LNVIISNNEITNINISNNKSLDFLYLPGNLISYLDVSCNSLLKKLELKRNKSSGKLVATQNQKNDHPE
jgi:hypothetical protein